MVNPINAATMSQADWNKCVTNAKKEALADIESRPIYAGEAALIIHVDDNAPKWITADMIDRWLTAYQEVFSGGWIEGDGHGDRTMPEGMKGGYIGAGKVPRAMDYKGDYWRLPSDKKVQCRALCAGGEKFWDDTPANMLKNCIWPVEKSKMRDKRPDESHEDYVKATYYTENPTNFDFFNMDCARYVAVKIAWEEKGIKEEYLEGAATAKCGKNPTLSQHEQQLWDDLKVLENALFDKLRELDKKQK